MTRKPSIYLLIIIPILFIGYIGIVILLLNLYSRFWDIPFYLISNLNGLLITLPVLFLWIPISLFLGNNVIYRFHPLRQIAEQFILKEGYPSYYQSQVELMKVIKIISIICIPIILLGFVI
jgi:hypothetical protein